MRGDLVAFLDSNVLVYAVSRNEPEKQGKAKAIVERGFAEGCFCGRTGWCEPRSWGAVAPRGGMIAPLRRVHCHVHS